MAVFLYCAALTHCFGDFLTHRWRSGNFIFLHAFLYALFYIPLFLWFGIALKWLFLIFLSHVLIDSAGAEWISWGVKTFIRKESDEKLLRYIGFGVDQASHLLVPLIIALFIFQ